MLYMTKLYLCKIYIIIIPTILKEFKEILVLLKKRKIEIIFEKSLFFKVR